MRSTKNAIIQHNFTSGLGDCIVAVTEYIENAKLLKSLGYKLHLKIFTGNNQYYSNLNLFDLFDNTEFRKYFDTIEHIEESQTKYTGFNIKYISYAAANPGMHWWDLFLDTDDSDYDVVTFPQNGFNYKNIYDNICKIKFTDNVKKYLDNFALEQTFVSLYLRSYDYNDNISNIINNQNIHNIYKNNKNIFICSNSYQIKSYFINEYPDKTLFLSCPLESDIGNHFGSNCGIEPLDAKKRTLISLTEILILSYSQIIFFHTEWGRISNFLFIPYINNVPIKIIL